MGTWVLGPPGRHLSGTSPHGEVFLLLLLHLHRTACGSFSLKCGCFFLRLKLLLWFLMRCWPWVIGAWVSQHRQRAPTPRRLVRCARWSLRLTPGYPDRAWRHVVRWDGVIATEPCSAVVRPNQSAASVIDCDSYDLVYLTCHCSYNRVKGCSVANVSQCTIMTYDSQSHTVAMHSLIGCLWKVRVPCLKISFKIYKHFQSFQTKYFFLKEDTLDCHIFPHLI